MALIFSFPPEGNCLRTPNSSIHLHHHLYRMPLKRARPWTGTCLSPDLWAGPVGKDASLTSTALTKWSKTLSRDLPPSVSCHKEAASQSQFRQCVVLAAVFPKCKPNWRSRIHKNSSTFCMLSCQGGSSWTSWLSSIKLLRIFSVWEIPHCHQLG